MMGLTVGGTKDDTDEETSKEVLEVTAVTSDLSDQRGKPSSPIPRRRSASSAHFSRTLTNKNR